MKILVIEFAHGTTKHEPFTDEDALKVAYRDLARLVGEELTSVAIYEKGELLAKVVDAYPVIK